MVRTLICRWRKGVVARLRSPIEDAGDDGHAGSMTIFPALALPITDAGSRNSVMRPLGYQTDKGA